MRSTVAVVALASVAAASMAADYDGGYANEDVVADGYVEEPYHEDYGVDNYDPQGNGVPDIIDDYPVLPDECIVDGKDKDKGCDKHHVSPERPVVYETVVHTVISCSEEVSILAFDICFDKNIILIP